MKSNKIYCYEPWNRGEIFSIFIVNESKRKVRRDYSCAVSSGSEINIVEEKKSEKDQKKIRNRSAKSRHSKSAKKINFLIFAYQVEPLCERKCDNFPLANVHHRQPCERRKIEERKKCRKKKFPLSDREENFHCYFWWGKIL